jgi:hypothetical protein
MTHRLYKKGRQVTVKLRLFGTQITVIFKKIMKYSPTCNLYLELTVVYMCIVIRE